MEFMELIETFRAEDAYRAVERGEEGHRAVGGLRGLPDYHARLNAALDILETARTSRRGMLRFHEAMSTSDFPLLMGDVLDRQLLGMYAETPQTWSSYCRRGTVPDFRPVKRFAVDGAEGVLPEVTEDEGTYKPQVLSETPYSYVVKKYGRQMKFRWDAWINDDLNALGASSPARMARSARRTEDRLATALHVGTSGPLNTVYTTANRNIINTTNGASSTNPALGIIGLQDAFVVMGNQRDADGEPIYVTGAILEVPPALEVVARNILNATEIKVGADSAAQQIFTGNWMRNKLTLVVNPYIPILASSSNGNSTWFVHIPPSEGRPGFEVGFLRGNEEPALFQKIGDQQRLGGTINPFDGSFDDDTTAYKIRHVVGGTALDGKATYSSNGSGS